jgi:thiol-disulfide isomerase/thioredoxin
MNYIMNSSLIIAILLIVIVLILATKAGSWPGCLESFTPGPVSDGISVVNTALASYYDKYTEAHALSSVSGSRIIVIYHFTTWCPACKRMSPIFEAVRNDIMNNPDLSGVYIEANDEDKNKTPGITGYPTIIRYQYGKMRQYDGPANYNQLRQFVLSATGPTERYSRFAK